MALAGESQDCDINRFGELAERDQEFTGAWRVNSWNSTPTSSRNSARRPPCCRACYRPTLSAPGDCFLLEPSPEGIDEKSEGPLKHDDDESQ
jgi:hypothetical protein